MLDRLIDSKEKREKETCDTCKAALEEINKSDDNCPVVLEKMIFHVFSHYMSTKESKHLGGTSLLPAMVGSEVPSLVCIV